MRKEVVEMYLPVSDKYADVECIVLENNAELKEYMEKSGDHRRYPWGPHNIWYSPEQMDEWEDQEWTIPLHEELNDLITEEW